MGDCWHWVITPVKYHFDEVFWAIAEMEQTEVKLGMDLLSFMKKEFGFVPSRKCLDFLLHACANANDMENSLLDGSGSSVCSGFGRCQGI
ncbi:unnamed protein product, partial [Thlaspi arvense]